jgi:hypothetical protein
VSNTKHEVQAETERNRDKKRTRTRKRKEIRTQRKFAYVARWGTVT